MGKRFDQKPENESKEVENEEAEQADVENSSEVESEDENFTDADMLDLGNFKVEVEAAANAAPEASPEEGAQPEAGADEEPAKSPAENKSAPDSESKDEPAAKIKFGNREFQNVAELQAFLDGLDESQKAIFAKLSTPAKEAEPEIDPADLLFEDPKKAVELIKQQIRNENKAIEKAKEDAAAAEKRRQQYWKNFYDSHPDLKEFEDIVESEVDALIAEKGADMKLDSALPLLAERSRKKLDRLKAKLMPGKELPNGKAIAHGTGGAEVPKRVEKPVVENMITQVKKFQRRLA